ncbi:hypothetical protein J2S13_001249 [Oikeobacillus pervagus]|uniref:Uncharacterized protein n=1 Tax=Oikeobacillus pervagus TaxID=1325931 RepID=A0AAJ1T128_9BACI|nr:hypothetical protein [Oikeobacillus pervagus]MDQ0214852.1 hypothetical protein [Oikeobacillus pervagus]
MREKKQDQEEYGMEFGDVNTAKLYEVTLKNQTKYKKKDKDCK